MSADTDAYTLSLQVSPELSEAEREYALLVCRHESFYGRATRPASWAGSHNWGAVKGTGPAGFFLADDERPQMKFRRYVTDADGWLDVVRILLKPNVRAALAQGDAGAAVEAQRANGYFTAPLDSYRAALTRNYEAWQKAMGREGVLHFPLVRTGSVSPGSPSSPSPSFVIRRAGNLPTLWEGSYGSAVTALCHLLTVTPSQRFDARVTAAVHAFQVARGLRIDGVVGELTWAELLKGTL